MKTILQDLYRLQTLDIGGGSRNATELQALRAGIPQGMLSNYDRARARGKKGIAVLRNHVCTNCRMQVPIAVTAGLRSGTVQVCGNCGLYLYIDPNEAMIVKEPEAPVAKRRKKRVVAAG